MKKHRSLLLLAAAVLVLGGILLWMETTDNASVSGTLYRMDEGEAVTDILIENLYGSYAFAKNEEGEWSVSAEGSTYRTHASKMELITAALDSIAVTRVLEEELPDYGLEAPQAVVTCTTTGGSTHSFAIGNETASHSEVYIRDQKTGRVMVTTTGAVAQFTGSLSAYRDKEIFTIDKNNIVTVEYYRDGEHQLTVDRTGGSWQLTWPFAAPARQIVMNELVSEWGSWTAAGFPQEGSHDYESMGLGQSGTWLTFTDASGESQRLTIGSAEGTGTYVRTGGEDEVAVMYTTDLDFSEFTPDALLFVAPLKATIDQLSGITVQTAAGTDSFIIEQLENGKQRVYLNGSEIDLNSFASVFSKYIGMNADGRDPAEITAQKAVAVLTSTYVDGTTAQLALLPRDESTYYMLLEGRTDYYMDATELETLLYRIQSARAAQ